MFLLLCATAFADDTDDAIPEVTARVARFSFLRGEVMVRHQGSQDWEKAVLNLPVVEGDEIVADAGSRYEIQFSSYTHARVSESSNLKITNLRDEGIALSLAEGTISIRLLSFDKKRSFFEIDAPKTTIAIEREGMYRIDAGHSGDSQIRVTALDKGEARVYSDDAGFTIKNGRSATINIAGALTGEYDTADAARYADEFDTWSLERDEVIARLLKTARYDEYYDRDIYGAEDLADNGDWVYTKKYGYVWRPYRSITSRYADWSPYRYGSWRWVPPFGWTWVNDEPWGWATYHHGRWISDDGWWYWTPYAYYRTSRSWWLPAVVGITIINNNYCWYPLPYNYGYYNYNYYWGRHGRHNGYNNGNWANNNGPGHNNNNPNTTPTAAPQIGPNAFTTRDQKAAWMKTPPLLRVPPSAVVSAPIGSFGTDRNDIAKLDMRDAKAALSKTLMISDPIRPLPSYDTVISKAGQDIRTRKTDRMTTAIRPETGAIVRGQDGGPLDQKLQKVRIYGDRAPVVENKPDPVSSPGVNAPVRRKTGAVERPVIMGTEDTPVRAAPTRVRENEPVRPEPVYTKPDRQTGDPVRPPRYEPQKSREDREMTPIRPSEPVRSKPREDRYNPPNRSEPIRTAPTRVEPPKREQRYDPPQRSEPVRNAPTRSEPPKQRESPPPSRSGPDKPESIKRKP